MRKVTNPTEILILNGGESFIIGKKIHGKLNTGGKTIIISAKDFVRWIWTKENRKDPGLKIIEQI